MRTVADLLKALEIFSPTAPVQVGLVGPDDRLVVHDIQAIEVREGSVVLRVEGHTPDQALETHMIEGDQTGEAIAEPPPPPVPGGPEGEGEEPEPPPTKVREGSIPCFLGHKDRLPC